MNLRRRFSVLLVALALGGCEDKPTPAPEPAPKSVEKPAPPPPSASASAAKSAAAAAPSASTSPSASAADPAASAPPLLWAIESKAGTSYLFGTMHLGADAEKQLHPMVMEKLDQAAAVMMEADLGSVSPTEMMSSAMLPPNAKPLDEELGAERWKKLVALVSGTMPLPAEALKRFKPWFMVVLITQSLLPPTPPMDQVMQDRAKKANKEMIYLETMKQQLDMLDKVMTIDLLKDAVDELDKQKTLVLDMQRAYLAGDVAKLELAVFDPAEIKKHPAMYELLFTKRNEAWLPIIEKRTASGKTFVAVGAGHLIGTEGLVALLAKKGIKAERVAPPP